MVRNVRSVLGESAGANHVEHCADCQAFFHAGDELELQLRRSARGQQTALVVPSGLDQRILRAVRTEGASLNPPRRLGADSRWSENLVPMAGMLAGAALLALLATPPTAVSVPTGVGTNPSRAISWSEIVPPVEVLQANPLQDEVDLVYSDAKSALQFLELNFLPAGTVRRSE
jgi:hypothetical protein